MSLGRIQQERQPQSHRAPTGPSIRIRFKASPRPPPSLPTNSPVSMKYDDPESFPGGLRGMEVYWAHRYEFLNSAGYQLRPRYRPGWVPSWQASKKSRWDVEDGVTLFVERIMDAVRTKDGTPVVIKRIF
ncbi:hypothetical protein K466DRAFT_562133, partial [Polyporus arcularius HHB13444]